MSVTNHVFFEPGKLPTTHEWSEAARAAGFGFELMPLDSKTHSGWWPCVVLAGLGGFEYFCSELEEDENLNWGIADRARRAYATFSVGSPLRAQAASIIGSAVFCLVTDGVLRIDETGELIPATRVQAWVEEQVSWLRGAIARQEAPPTRILEGPHFVALARIVEEQVVKQGRFSAPGLGTFTLKRRRPRPDLPEWPAGAPYDRKYSARVGFKAVPELLRAIAEGLVLVDRLHLYEKEVPNTSRYLEAGFSSTTWGALRRELVAAISAGEAVILGDLGQLRGLRTEARGATNPRTGMNVMIPGRIDLILDESDAFLARLDARIK